MKLYHDEMPKIIYFKGSIYRSSHYAKFNTSIWLYLSSKAKDLEM